MTAVVVQGMNFWPWVGFFDKVRQADVVVMGDQTAIAPVTRRVRILGPNGPQWFGVPLSGSSMQRIDEAHIAVHQPWRQRLDGMLRTAYAKHPYFPVTLELVTDVHSHDWKLVRNLNEVAVRLVAGMLGLKAEWVRASELTPDIDDREQRLLTYCREVGADTLLSGPNARQYRDYGLFAREGIEVLHHEYECTPYVQFGRDGFEPYMSVIDALMNCGLHTRELLTGKFVAP